MSQKPIEKDLAGVADIHLLDPFVQGRDEYRRPVATDRARGLAVAE